MSKSTPDDETEEENRGTIRRLAALGGAAVGTASAGCLGMFEEEEEPEPEPTPTPTPEEEETPTPTPEEEETPTPTPEPPEEEPAVELGMVVDLQRCVGCDACNIACKNENNVQEGHAWAHREVKTEGSFPDVSYEYFPTLCNQCRDAPCVESCPVQGEALYYGPGGITMLNPEACIGCWQCVANCPYDKSFANEEEPHTFWRDDEATVADMTASPEEVTEAAGGDTIPYSSRSREWSEHESPLRFEGTAEKCTFCYHRVSSGELPACVEECPSDARIFGDLNDPDSAVSQLVDEYDSWRWKEEEGTDPKVHYIREFDGSSDEPGHDWGKGDVPELEEA